MRITFKRFHNCKRCGNPFHAEFKFGYICGGCKAVSIQKSTERLKQYHQDKKELGKIKWN
jgi:hypothetical protein